MLHHRSPTRTGYPPIHAALALRHTYPSIPTLLSPLRSITNTHLLGPDAFDDFQSNAWINSPSYRPSLAGLGISYLSETFSASFDQPFAPDDSPLRLHTDTDDRFLSLHDGLHSTDIFPNQFPAPNMPYKSFDPFLCDELANPMDFGFDGEIDPTASSMAGLIPDVNMNDKLRRMDLPHLGVNPLDTIRRTPPHDIGTFYQDSGPPMVKDQHADGGLPITDTNVEQSPSPRVIQDIMSILVRPAPEISIPAWSPVDSSSVQGLSPSRLIASISPTSVKLESAYTRDREHEYDYPNTTHSSPVLNAHLGIELSKLMSKAERFRAKNPDRDIDRAWLSHFAGKLSDRGELLNDFRCYVLGCDQRNKRRDHILVHVGAHIGQRPFACSMCPMRFLRKNECKRHEASHSGSRPYSCDICGQSFVRQDLVKRHVKRTHVLRDENEFAVGRQSSRKKARLR